MDSKKRQFLLAEEDPKYQQRKCVFEHSDTVEAIDLTTRSNIRLCAADLSAYRHTLRLEGKIFRILSILEFAG